MASYLVFVAVWSVVLAPALTTTNFALAQTVAGCTANSFATPSWFIQDFQYSKASSASFGDVSLRVLNRATNASTELACRNSDDTVKVGQDAASSGGWTLCSSKNGQKTGGALDAFFQLNGTSATLLVNETWSCNDKSPDKPYDATT